MKDVITILKYTFPLLLLITSCQYHCDGYDSEQTAALAFRLGDTIFYKSNKSDTITLFVNNFHAEEASSHSAVMVMDYECSKDAYYTTITEEAHGISIKEGDSQGGSTTSPELIIFCNNDIYEIASWKNDYDSKSLDSIIVDNTIYKNVREIKDLTGNRRISNFIKAPYYGIIKFYDSHEGLTWEQIRIARMNIK